MNPDPRQRSAQHQDWGKASVRWSVISHRVEPEIRQSSGEGPARMGAQLRYLGRQYAMLLVPFGCEADNVMRQANKGQQIELAPLIGSGSNRATLVALADLKVVTIRGHPVALLICSLRHLSPSQSTRS